MIPPEAIKNEQYRARLTGQTNPLAVLLFVTKRDHRVNFSSATSRHETGRQSHSYERERCADEGCKVCRAEAIEETRQNARDYECRRQPQSYSDQNGDDASPHHEFQNVFAISAQSHANADLARALADRISNHAVNSCDRQRQGKQTEHAE